MDVPDLPTSAAVRYMRGELEHAMDLLRSETATLFAEDVNRDAATYLSRADYEKRHEQLAEALADHEKRYAQIIEALDARHSARLAALEQWKATVAGRTVALVAVLGVATAVVGGLVGHLVK